MEVHTTLKVTREELEAIDHILCIARKATPWQVGDKVQLRDIEELNELRSLAETITEYRVVIEPHASSNTRAG